jgi:hypothetical protein
MLEKLLVFGCMHKNKTFFLNENLFFKFLIFLKFQRKPDICNTELVSYNVNIQSDIMQNCWKNMRGAHKYFQNAL